MKTRKSGVLGWGMLCLFLTQLACSFHPVLDGPRCQEGSRCPSGCTCFEGICIPENKEEPVDCTGCASDTECDDQNACTEDRCQEGSCENRNLADQTPCDDGTYCTEDDACLNGNCRGKPRRCEPSSDSPCIEMECNDEQAMCLEVPAVDGTPCPDDLFCTAGEICLNGECVVTAGTCPDSSDPCQVSVCDESTETCMFQAKPQGSSCDDGDLCTEGGTCVDGLCVSVPASCDDGLYCTIDTCDPASGCQHQPVWDPGTEDTCSDGLDQDCDGVADGCCLGNGHFSLSDWDVIPPEPRLLQAGDLDRDNILDLVVVSRDLARVYLGQGSNGQADGRIQLHLEIPLEQPITDLVLVDFDRDGVLDVAAPSETSDEILMARGENGVAGDYALAQVPPVPVCQSPRTLVVLDYNRDGLKDLAVGCQLFPRIMVLLGNPDTSSGMYFLPGPEFPLAVPPEDLAVADVWQDGWPDLIAACPRLGGNQSFVVIQPVTGPNDPAGLTPIHLPMDGRPVTVEPADFNRDGMVDLLTVDEELGQVNILRGTLSDQPDFQLVVQVEIGNMPWTAALEDFNADAILDFAVSTLDGVHVYLGGGSNGRWDQTFSRRPPQYPGHPTAAVLTAELNADGIPDLSFLKTIDSEVKVHTGDGSGGVPDGGFHPLQPVPVEPNPYFPASADLNGDGILDLAVPQSLANSVAILIGQGENGRGNGRFLWHSDIPVGEFPRWVAAGDLNRDGRTDLAVANLHGSSVSLLINQTDQVSDSLDFSAHTIFLAGDIIAVEMADLDRDGRLDLAVVDQFNDILFVLTKLDFQDWLPEPAFELADLLTCEQPNALLIRDFNADDLLDVAVACSRGGSGMGSVGIHKHTNLADSWNLPLNQTLFFDSNVRGLGSCDTDSDGLPELMALLWDMDQVAFLSSDGDTWFSDAGRRLPVGVQPSDLLVSDFNRDGACDLVVSAQDASLTVWLGDGVDGSGTGDFNNQQVISLGQGIPGASSYGLVSGRFNRDGFTDLALALPSMEISSVQVLLGLGVCHP